MDNQQRKVQGSSSNTFIKRAFQHLKSLFTVCFTGADYLESDIELICQNEIQPQGLEKLNADSSNFYCNSLTSNQSLTTSMEALDLSSSLTTPHADKLLKLSNLIAAKSFTTERKLSAAEFLDSREIHNPFTYGFLGILYGTSRTPYLHAQYANSFMSESAVPISIELNNREAKASMNLAEKNFPEGFEDFVSFLENPNIPLTVLLHHVMLYDLYSNNLKDAVWVAVTNYMKNLVGNYGYTELHIRAAQQMFGHPRFLLVHPEDIYCISGSSDWVCVSTQHFHCNIHVHSVSGNAIRKSRNPIIQDLSSICQNSTEFGWLALTHALRKKGAIFPIHAYLNFNAKLYEECIPPSILYFNKNDENINVGNIEDITNYMYETFINEASLCDKFMKRKHERIETPLSSQGREISNTLSRKRGAKGSNPFEIENMMPHA
ncbi:UPF0300 family protein 4 [Schizosaccharomyces pombe]|uniref:Meiotically up-regulated gene 131 protein n=1 Tax=Schizosaccharomyces pombe (strain 972 / ATCC 24843) TaxID=284812 RepID=MU131_SCHPO|nr:uncharacterized protein SPBC1861.06c [Schizosaccharomyces pombe]Q9USY0.1 RecName: Full=Meiotically up-regulated gene 131 protein [Schizosaccharomyces pombe 972h-]CAB52742.1 S. pombe specific UPF0300 family protein 4 [Schizosaccharomyces pombe]|eukprot:NP_596723.1 uncharacterized protein SPBC1861.06c [Schizosaccharomyces pombe]